jgi:hypothetical protein
MAPTDIDRAALARSLGGQLENGRHMSECMRWIVTAGATALTLGLMAMACGGGSDSPTAPSTPPPSSGAPTVNSLTLTVTANGLSAPSGDLAVGGTVTIMNSDSVPHEMSSNPHPEHTDCPALNVGVLNPGQSRTTAPVTSARACGMHDHINPGTQALMRTIVVR